MFRLLAAPDLPKRAMWSGALLGAVGFEILKQVSGLLIRSTQGQPAFQVFGLALILLVWINYFSRVILYAASWAWTHPLAREQRVVEPAEPVQGPPLPSVDELADTDEQAVVKKGAFAAGAAVGRGRRDRHRPSWPRRRLLTGPLRTGIPRKSPGNLGQTAWAEARSSTRVRRLLDVANTYASPTILRPIQRPSYR